MIYVDFLLTATFLRLSLSACATHKEDTTELKIRGTNIPVIMTPQETNQCRWKKTRERGDVETHRRRTFNSHVQNDVTENVQFQKCNIPRICFTELKSTFPPNGLVPPLFLEPIIISSCQIVTDNISLERKPTKPRYNSNFAERTSLMNITNQFPENFEIVLSSSNSYSAHRRKISLLQYLNETLEMSLESKETRRHRSDEHWYLFGETFTQEWKNLLRFFELPPCMTCTRDLSALSFGIGGMGSGVQWHVHGPGFSEVIHGRKYWLLYPPDKVPTFDPNYTSLHWMEYLYPNLSQEEKNTLYECSLHPGEMLYFPDRWYHATINLDSYNVFVSTFTTEHFL